MDDTDILILNRIQSNFPLTKTPYADIAKELGLAGDVVIERIQKLKEEGIIRRIGGNFAPDRLGYVSTLCAAKVPQEKIDDFAKIINRYPGVTHNYVRENDYNVWFTFIAPSMEDIEKNLRQIAMETGIREILNLPALRVFKVKAKFTLENE